LSKPTVDLIKQRGIILIGTTGDYRPLSFCESEDGTYWGFCIEVTKLIAKKMDVDIEFVKTSWPTLSADVQVEPQTFDIAIGGITITDARRETSLCTKNEEIPSLIAEGKADVMITEITEAPYYVKNDARLAAPLLNKPFNHGEIGVLMRKGQDDLLQLVNDIIRIIKADGTLRQLHEKYGLVYGY